MFTRILKTLVLGIAASCASAITAGATTLQFLPSNGVDASGIFSLRLDGLTGETTVSYGASAVAGFSCTFSIFDPVETQTCPTQQFFGNLSAPNEFSAKSGFAMHNFNIGVQSDSDFGMVALSPDSNILTLNYEFNGSGLASASFFVTYAEGTPLVLEGSLAGSDGSQVPLPAALPLLAAGVGGLGMMGRWQRRRLAG